MRTCARVFLLGVALLVHGWPAASQAAQTITRHDIRWTFDRNYPTGTFANGDPWVVGPVNIVGIDPPSQETDGRVINGSMLNPAVGNAQGYDSAAYGPRAKGAFDPALNVALGVSEAQPLHIPPGHSLVSVISHREAGKRPQLASASVLTVLPEPAPPGSFRPPYTGQDKALRWNVRDLDETVLRDLPRVAGTPDVGKVAARLERPWIEHNTSWMGGFIHPSNNQPHYGRDMANDVGEALLLLQLDLPRERKRQLLIRVVQYGLDIYGVAQNGGVWTDDGGHNLGRKLPLLLAGKVLGDERILAYADARRHPIFQEDRQTWTVSRADVGRPVSREDKRKREPYRIGDVGLPEWGEKHTSRPERDGRNWDAPYRNVAGHAMLGHALAARLMGFERDWNWPSFFAYADRYWLTAEHDKKHQGNTVRPFVRAMWDKFRRVPPDTLPPASVAEHWSGADVGDGQRFPGGGPDQRPTVPAE